jgi:hypothetical protein
MKSRAQKYEQNTERKNNDKKKPAHNEEHHAESEDVVLDVDTRCLWQQISLTESASSLTCLF